MTNHKSDWSKMGKERLKEFREYVEKAGYFLGVYRDTNCNSHLVVTRNVPNGEVQDCFFVFNWVNTDAEKVFISPSDVTEKPIYTLDENYSLNLSPEDVIPRFENARKKMDEHLEYRKKYNF